jgi:hypothetical protein
MLQLIDKIEGVEPNKKKRQAKKIHELLDNLEMILMHRRRVLEAAL